MAEKISLRKQKKVQARQKILLAAAQQFESQGFANTSIAGIMQEARLGVGTFYNYFRSKEEVLLTLAKILCERKFYQSKTQISRQWNFWSCVAC